MTNSEQNLCDICVKRYEFPKCITNNIEFGNGVGNDNIIDCINFDKLEDIPENLKVMTKQEHTRLHRYKSKI